MTEPSFMTPNNRRMAPNDGRRVRNTRPRNYNMSFSPPRSPHLPPSTWNGRSINMDRMEHGYNSIVDSINNLAYQQHIRRGVDITNGVLSNVTRRSDLRQNGADVEVIETYNLLIADYVDISMS